MQQSTRYVKGETAAHALDEIKCSKRDGCESALAVNRRKQISVGLGGQGMASVLQVPL